MFEGFRILGLKCFRVEDLGLGAWRLAFADVVIPRSTLAKA